ncbi:WecB/TagA/CpsF family glycosyltransferase [Mycolicibacterium rutilum]|nr:WecB/TagA/CpsF family glycosyltransferase [Mycolicibacterium rutilum]
MPIDAVTMDGAVHRISDSIANGRGGTVLTPNIEILRQYRSTPELRSVFERTDLRVVDGMPLVVALRLQRTPVPEQITGTDLLWALSGAAAQVGFSVLLAGGRDGDAERAAERLRAEFSGLRARTHACFVRPDTEAEELARLRATIIAAEPDVVFIGLPFRVQVTLMDELRAALPRTWFVGVGSTFELVNGDRSRPPKWLQRLCLEWAWRLTQQPEMWRRYFVDGMPTAALLLASALRQRWRRA